MTVQMKRNELLSIYFADSLSHTPYLHDHTHSQIRELLESYGNMISSEHALPSYFSKEPYEREIQLIQIADCLVIDATLENTAIGWKIGTMQYLGKPILYLHHADAQKELPPFLRLNPNIEIGKYQPARNLESIIDSFFSKHFHISRLVLV